MKTSDVKRLWGRSGNRCAIGRNELSSDDSGVIGDTCHIVAQSPDGPRGDSPLTRAERDGHDNLILLCPTHHRIIDSNEELWPVETLYRIKREHEQWVSDRLDKLATDVEHFDNAQFLKKRLAEWSQKPAPFPALCIALTPYQISDDVVVANDRDSLSLVSSAAIGFSDKGHGGFGDRVNSNLTKPSPDGMRNETFNRDAERKYLVELCRSGHCECLLSFEETLRGWEEQNAKYASRTGSATYVIHYQHLANAVASSLEWLLKVWDSKLPFHEMTLTVAITNANSTNLFAQEYGMSDPVFGTKIEGNAVSLERVVFRDFDMEELIFSILTRVTNSYGLWLHVLRQENGDWHRPDRHID